MLFVGMDLCVTLDLPGETGFAAKPVAVLAFSEWNWCSATFICSRVSLSISLRKLRSSAAQNENAVPVAPALPVRPMR